MTEKDEKRFGIIGTTWIIISILLFICTFIGLHYSDTEYPTGALYALGVTTLSWAGLGFFAMFAIADYYNAKECWHS